MSIATVLTGGPEGLWEPAVSGEIIDGLTDGVASRVDAVTRAEVVSGIVFELVTAVTWRCGDGADADELSSLRRLVDAAEAHRRHMLARQVLAG